MVVLDKASYHRNAAVKAYVANKGMGIIYLPSSSSALSSVETSWAIFKSRFAKYLAKLGHEEIRGKEIKATVREQMSLFVDSYDATIVARHCYKEMSKVMQGVRV